jgi:hypothetical protein
VEIVLSLDHELAEQRLEDAGLIRAEPVGEKGFYHPLQSLFLFVEQFGFVPGPQGFGVGHGDPENIDVLFAHLIRNLDIGTVKGADGRVISVSYNYAGKK